MVRTFRGGGIGGKAISRSEMNVNDLQQTLSSEKELATVLLEQRCKKYFVCCVNVSSGQTDTVSVFGNRYAAGNRTLATGILEPISDSIG